MIHGPPIFYDSCAGVTGPAAGPRKIPRNRPDTTDGQNTDITPAEMGLFDRMYKYFCRKGYLTSPINADTITGISDGTPTPPDIQMSEREMNEALTYAGKYGVHFASARIAILCRRDPRLNQLERQVQQLEESFAGPAPAYHGELDRDGMDRALRYAATHDCDFFEARRAILSGVR